MANLAGLLERTAEAYPDRAAVVFGDATLSYAEVDAAANRVANLLVSRGVRPGDRVALSCPNLPSFPTVYFGILKAGAVVVPLNVLLKSREIAYHLADSGARAYIAFEGTVDLAIGDEAWTAFEQTPSCTEFFVIQLDSKAPAPLVPPEHLAPLLAEQPTTFETVERDDEDTAVILYTSGTTGRPKGAELRHRNMRANALVSDRLFDASVERPDTYLGVLPLFHSFGQTVTQNACFAYGGTLVMLPRFDPTAAIALMVRHEVTFFAGVPTMYWGLLSALTDDVPVDRIAANLRVAVAGGAALPAEIHHRVAERFGVTILEGYGLSETSPVASFSPWGQPPRVGSIGTPIPGVQMRLLTPDGQEVTEPDGVGEIAIRGDNVMKGYFGRPEETAAAIVDGWFRTGDLARKDADGWYYIVDRAKDMILRGGYNVYPREIEEVLMAHPAVSLVAVIGVPHEQLGEEIAAYVVPTPGAEVTEDELVAWAREQLAAYKYPRTVAFVESLPMTSTGKILKRELR